MTVEVALKSKIRATDRYRKYLKIVSVFLLKPLTNTEIDIIENLFLLSEGILTSEVRSKICDELNISSNQLNNYIRQLRIKNVIVENELNSIFKRPQNLNVSPTNGDALVVNFTIKAEIIP